MPTQQYMDMVKDTIEFAQSPRGKFIQAQALYYGIKQLSTVEGVMKEVSNIQDMRYLLDVLYAGYEDIFDHIEQQRCTLKNGAEIHNHMGDSDASH
tara:strand:+ start:121 stop:408 length:288 start_codon:yes stop_codon:yes gene_type:complete